MTLLTSSNDLKGIEEIKIMAAIRDFMNRKKMLIDENGMNNPITTRKEVMDHIAQHNPQLDGIRLPKVPEHIECPIYKWNGERLHTFQNYRCPKCGRLFMILVTKKNPATGRPLQRSNDPAFCPCNACVAFVGHKCIL